MRLGPGAAILYQGDAFSPIRSEGSREDSTITQQKYLSPSDSAFRTKYK